MIQGRRVVVVMPAFNASQTLVKTFSELPMEVVDEVIVVDDCSEDTTATIARELGASTIRHDVNIGYGGNQKSCYRAALESGADIVVMVHPDYQYAPSLCGAMAWMIASDEYDVVLGSRILGRGALEGGMPWWRYVANRALTFVENILVNLKLSEFHTGYRSFSAEVLETLPLEENSDDFVFDNQILVQTAFFGYRIGEVSCPTRYRPDSSSIDFVASCKYGIGVLWTATAYRLQRMGLGRFRIFSKNGRRLEPEHARTTERQGDGGSPDSAPRTD